LTRFSKRTISQHLLRLLQISIFQHFSSSSISLHSHGSFHLSFTLLCSLSILNSYLGLGVPDSHVHKQVLMPITLLIFHIYSLIKTFFFTKIIFKNFRAITSLLLSYIFQYYSFSYIILRIPTCVFVLFLLNTSNYLTLFFLQKISICPLTLSVAHTYAIIIIFFSYTY